MVRAALTQTQGPSCFVLRLASRSSLATKQRWVYIAHKMSPLRRMGELIMPQGVFSHLDSHALCPKLPKPLPDRHGGVMDFILSHENHIIDSLTDFMYKTVTGTPLWSPPHWRGFGPRKYFMV